MKRINSFHLLFFLIVSCLMACNKKDSKLSLHDRQLTMADTNQILEVAVDAFDEDFGVTFEKQPLRILPNKFIRPGTKLQIKSQPVRFVELDSSQMDSVFARPLFYLTLFDFKFLTDSTARVSIVFRDVGDGGRFLFERNPANQWVITTRSFFKL